MELQALVVDDSKIMRKMVMQSLNRTSVADFQFVEAENGEDALNKFKEASPDIVFVDWNMPKMSGVDFVRAVRALPEGADVPVVMVTSERKMDKVETALDEAGADEYICKPFTPEEIERKVSKLLEKIEKRKSKAGGFFSKLLGG